ncbi:MAG: acyl-CoA dehydrogenase, partial [Dehalococcoidia bacterium]|nr:acyl-CoA dehydrogenase [Dehalococcoidia bacterium]
SAVPQGNGYVINGMKRFSTFGARDGYAVLYAKDETGKCTAFVVRKNVQGYSAKKTWKVMGSGGIEASDVFLDDLKVPAGNILGEKGKGFSMLLAWVAIEKTFQCAANVGLAQAACDEAVKYAKARISRGKPISDMQGIRWMLADMQCQLEASRWLTYRTAYILDRESADAASAAATAKLFVIPATIGVAESSRRIHGAYGYAQEFKIERLCRAVVAATSVATTLEVNRSIVAASLVR